MAPRIQTTTKVMLLAVAVTGLVFAGLATTTAHEDPKDVDDHALSRTFPDLTAGVRTVVCSEEVATLLGFGAPKDPTEPECNEDNPNWLVALNTGGATSSSFYYDLLRIRPVLKEECPDIGGIADNVFKAGNRCETDITQSALLGLGNPNDWYASAKDGDVSWILALCNVGDEDFQNETPFVDPLIPLNQADAIDCPTGDGWKGHLDATDLIIDFGPNSVGTGFFRPTIEQVWGQLSDAEKDKGGLNQDKFLGSCLLIDQVVEVKLGAANVAHVEERIGGGSLIDSHDWFYVVNPLASSDPTNNVLYSLAGSDAQGDDRRPDGLC